MPVKKLKEFLDDQNIKYITVDHSPAYTAREVAASTFVVRREFAKTVMVKVDGKLAMAVVPANHRVDLDKLATAIGTGKVELANEEEFKNSFPDCELGAMPPFGDLYDMQVYACTSLDTDDYIVFNAGSHTQVIEMSGQDYLDLVKPTVIDFSTKM